jgi:hypothetical protein
MGANHDPFYDDLGWTPSKENDEDVYDEDDELDPMYDTDENSLDILKEDDSSKLEEKSE